MNLCKKFKGKNLEINTWSKVQFFQVPKKNEIGNKFLGFIFLRLFLPNPKVLGKGTTLKGIETFYAVKELF